MILNDFKYIFIVSVFIHCFTLCLQRVLDYSIAYKYFLKSFNLFYSFLLSLEALIFYFFLLSFKEF